MTTSRATIEGPEGAVALATPAARARWVPGAPRPLKRCPTRRCRRRSDGLFSSLDVEPSASLVLGWDALRALAADGVALAPHSRTHPLLTRVDAERARRRDRRIA